MEQQIRAVGQVETAGCQIGFDESAGRRDAVLPDEGDVARPLFVIALAGAAVAVALAVRLRLRWRGTDEPSGVLEQGTAGEAGRGLQRLQTIRRAVGAPAPG